MCIAIWKPEHIRLYRKTVQNCFLHHPDGAGFVVHHPENNTLSLHKGFFTVESLWDALKPYMLNNVVIHFRWATHGEKNEENCHPFMVNENLAMVHNGVIKDIRMWDKTKSDTWHFNEAFMKKMCEKYTGICHNPVINTLLEDFIGKGSKLIFMDNFGKVSIVNESAGVWDTQCWFSNLSYQKAPDKPRERKTTSSSTTSNVTVVPSQNNGTATTNTMRQYRDANKYGQNNVYNSNDPTPVVRRSTDFSGIDPRILEFYKGMDKNRDELLLETLFMECENEEISRNEIVVKAMSGALNLAELTE